MNLDANEFSLRSKCPSVARINASSGSDAALVFLSLLHLVNTPSLC